MKRILMAFIASLLLVTTTVTAQTPTVSKKLSTAYIGAIAGSSINNVTDVKEVPTSITEVELLIEEYLGLTQKTINYYWLHPTPQFDELIYKLWIAEYELNGNTKNWDGLISTYSRPPGGSLGCAMGCWYVYYHCVPLPEPHAIPNRCTEARDLCLAHCIMWGGSQSSVTQKLSSEGIAWQRK